MPRLYDWSRFPADNRYSAGVGALVFISFVTAGCAYIIAAKLEGLEPLYVTFVPIAAMLAYALLITLARALRLRDDQSGDNLYYMGFLFTLTSLGVSLYQFSASHAAEEIVQNFGIAIGSTIAGIGLRVIFNQMRRDPIEVERMMRLELAEAARKLRRELDSSVVEFGYFRRSAQQSAVDSLNHMSESFDQLTAKFFARLDDITKNATLPVEAASRTSGASIAALSKTIGATLAAGVGRLSSEIEKLSDQVAAIAASLDAMTARFNAMQTPERVIEVRLEPIAHLLTHAVERAIAQSESHAKAVQEALAIAGSAAVSSNDLVAALRGEFGVTSAANRSAIDAAMTRIKSTEEALNEIRANSRDYLEAFGIVLLKADETMRTFTDILVQSSAESAAWGDRLSETLPAIEAKVQALAVTADRISLLVEDLRHKQRRSKPETVA